MTVRRVMTMIPGPRACATSLLVAMAAVTGCTDERREIAAPHAAALETALAAELAATPSGTAAIYLVVEGTSRNAGAAGRLATLLADHDVTAVYTASNRAALRGAQPFADSLGVARIPYDFGADPSRFVQNLLSGTLPANSGRVAVLVLQPSQIHAFVTHVSAGHVTDTDLAAGEMFLVRIPGAVTRVRVE
jgi:hypothetical protein